MRTLNQSFSSGIVNIANKPTPNYSAVFAMLVSMVAASVLNVFPLNHLWANLRPLFLFVVMLFWVIHRPEVFGIGFVFIVGIISDFLLDTRLGQQALSGVFAVFLLQYMTKGLHRINDIMVWFFAAAATVVFSITLLVLQYLDGQVIIWRNGLPMFTSILTWPVVVFLLKRF